MSFGDKGADPRSYGNLIDIGADSKESDPEAPVNIYAELSKKQYHRLLSEEVEIEVPYGTVMTNRAGSRALRFVCANREVAVELEEGLDASGINWQEEFESENI